MKQPRQLVRNTDDPEQIREADQKEREASEDSLECWRAVLSTPAGRRVLWELMDQAGVWRSSWDPSAKIHFYEGARYVGLHILEQIKKVGHSILTQSMDEAKIREEKK